MLSLTVFGGLVLAIGSLYIGRRVYTLTHPPPPPMTPWGEQVGRTKSIQSLTKDASLATERVRRETIASARKVIRETRTQQGSTAGAWETYHLRLVP
jgi:hypothetical protein